MTKCTFHKFGTSGNIEKHDALCILPLNIVNEKIYIFIWFWLLLLGKENKIKKAYNLKNIKYIVKGKVVLVLTQPCADSCVVTTQESEEKVL